jgi:hypothetical protein
VRRIVALVVIAFLGATLYGLSNASSGISVNGTTVSNATFRSELAAISSNINLQCYIAALNPVNYGAGAGGASIAATGAASWANLRVEGVAIDQFATSHLGYHATTASLASATTSLESEMSQAAASHRFTCAGSPAQALSSMPAEMRHSQIEAQDASLYLISKLNSTIPITSASLHAYYVGHLASYDTVCVSIALVPTSSVSAFLADQNAGASVAALAKKYSTDPSGAKGGTYGCFSPANSSYSSVRADTIATALTKFPTTPVPVSATSVLFVAPMKRRVTPFARAESLVLADVRNANAATANVQRAQILYRAAIAVDPAFGRWALTSTGPSVFTAATPEKVDVGATAATKALSTASAATYK